MGKEWVPPGENVGNISICYFWLARRCRCLHNKNTLAVSAPLLEKSWHHLERCLYRAAKTHRKRREAEAIAETRLQGRHWGHTGWGLIFHTCVWLALFLLTPNPLSSRLTLLCVVGGWPLGTALTHCLALWFLVGFNKGKARWSEGGRNNVGAFSPRACSLLVQLGRDDPSTYAISPIRQLSSIPTNVCRLWWTLSSKAPSGLGVRTAPYSPWPGVLHHSLLGPLILLALL